jgi:predicted nucleic acid-binding protein
VAGRVLVDTNVLVYLFDPREPVKRLQAVDIVGALEQANRGVLSQQVLSEFARVTSERVPHGPTRAELIGAVLDFSHKWSVLPVTPAVVAEALGIAGRTRRSFWDAQLIATAKVHGVATIVSEDFDNDSVCEGVRFVDPFAEGFSPSTLGL